MCPKTGGVNIEIRQIEAAVLRSLLAVIAWTVVGWVVIGWLTTRILGEVPKKTCSVKIFPG